MNYEKGQLYHIPLTDLQADPNQPRKYMDPQALEDLAASIQAHGVLTPILFRIEPVPEGSTPDTPPTKFIVAGERRLEAAKKAGLTEIPAILVDGNTGEIALVENLLRQDLTPVEEAEALDRLMKEQAYTQEQLGVIIGKARTTVNEILSLNRLPQEIRDECRSNPAVTRKALINISRKKQTRGMLTAWKKLKEKLVKEESGQKRQKKSKPAATPSDLKDWIDKTNERLAAIDPSAWSDAEKADFVASLTNLKKTILALVKK
ncbi:ParB/RepB/Spo0J family partition protein [Desulfatirhabdium butyrativorans]|uniref:ParB/RepB/Spo0J family partition protein n=1 Tax=Desulfatirhabdium butyrativorans TaxID=340467 RepID=UPI000410F41F|nr:ParB/RepB/Spo0J family partition protein [Desulfatirhabdium butyrativorans]